MKEDDIIDRAFPRAELDKHLKKKSSPSGPGKSL